MNLDADGRWQLTSRESRTVKGKQEFLPATVTLAESGGALPELAGQLVNVAGRWSETEYELFLNGKRVAGGPVADPAGAVPTLRPTGVKLGIRMDRDGPAAFDIDYAAVWDLADSDRLAAQHALSIGGTVRAAADNTAVYQSNLATVVGYVLKGACPAAARALGFERLAAAGNIIGKRAATSQNIGPTARALKAAN